MRPSSTRSLLPVRIVAALLAVAAFATTTAPASAATFAVGVGAGCTHADLSSALVAAASNPGQDDIKLLAGSIHQGQFIASSSGGLSIAGGFPTCGAALPTGTSTLRGDNASRALFLLVTGGAASLSRLQFTGGSVAGDGGGVLIQGDGFVQFIDVLVFGNSATGRGGNLFVNASAGFQLNFFGTVLVSAGSAADGGGLACTGPGLVVIGSGTTVANNQASDDGGGLYLSAGCRASSTAGGSTGGIVANVAGGDGGGAYIEGGAELNTGLGGGALATIEANSAGNGGGVYLTGAGSLIRAYFAEVTGNHADGAGGGVYVDDGALASFARPAGSIDPCPDPVRCSLVRNNSAVVGGAAQVVDGGRVDSHGSHFEGNVATLFGPVANVESGGVLALRSTVIAANHGLTPINVTGAGSTLVLGNVTFAANTGFGGGLINLGSGGLGPVRILTSAFDQQGALFVGFPAGAAPQLDCLMTRHAGLLTGLPPNTVSRAVTVADPQLANPAAGNYQLKGTSPAIDACDLTQWNTDDRDIEWQPRDVDHPGHPNVLPGGFRDLGADEFGVLFADGFESGHTGAWSDAVP